LISKKSSPLKPLGHMNQNLVGSILGRSFIKIAHFVPINPDLLKKKKSFGLFGQVVSEEKIFLEIDLSETRMACGGNVILL
jgi:hypothetical protein